MEPRGCDSPANLNLAFRSRANKTQIGGFPIPTHLSLARDVTRWGIKRLTNQQ